MLCIFVHLGYVLSTDYLSGMITNTSILSWIGTEEKTGNLGNKSFFGVLDYLYKSGRNEISINHNETYKHNMLYGIDYSEHEISQADSDRTTEILIPVGMCKVYEGKPLRYIEMNIAENDGLFEYFFYVSDPAASTHFQLPYSLMGGEKIVFESSSKHNKFENYQVKLKQTIDQTDDGSCTNYPTQQHNSYKTCVDEEMRSKMLPLLGCMVPWVSQRDQCFTILERLPKHESLLKELQSIILAAWGGYEYESENCPRPCTLISVEAKYLQSGTGGANNYISIDFAPFVQLEYIVLQYDFTQLVVEIGSSLGLWLGLSVVGLFDILVIVVDRINIFKKA